MIYYKDFDFSCIDATEIELKQGKRKISYLNIDFAVDIETSSFYLNGEKYAYPYCRLIFVVILFIVDI